MMLPIPLRIESNGYYEKCIANAKKELALQESRSEKEFAEYFETGGEKEQERQEANNRKIERLREKYDAMLEKLEAWNAPTDDHTEFKEFMQTQINKSIEWDCRLPTENKRTEPMKTLRQMKKEVIESARKNVAFWENALKENEERIASRNAWLKALQDSIGLPPRWVSVRKIHLNGTKTGAEASLFH